jgi:hypothetical protein
MTQNALRAAKQAMGAAIKAGKKVLDSSRALRFAPRKCCADEHQADLSDSAATTNRGVLE